MSEDDARQDRREDWERRVREAAARGNPCPQPRTTDWDVAHQRGLYLLKLKKSYDRLIADLVKQRKITIRGTGVK